MVRMVGGDVRRIREDIRNEGPKAFLAWLNAELSRKYDAPRLSRWEKGTEDVPDIVALFLAGRYPHADHDGGAPAAGRLARVLAVANHKGGVAKTTTAVNIAWGLVAAGLKVVIVDLDSQSDATLHLGYDREEVRATGRHMAAVMRGQCAIEDTLLSYDETDLWIAPSSKELTDAEKEVSASIGGEKRLAQKIEPLRTAFDVIIFDCGPNKNLFTINALSLAEFLVIPVQTEYLAVQGMVHLLDTVTQVRTNYNPSLTVLPVLPTMFARANRADRETLDELHRLIGPLVPIFHEPVPRATIFGQASASGHPALRAKPRAKGVAVYGEYAALVQQRLGIAAAKEVDHVG